MCFQATIEVLQAILSRPYNSHFHSPWSKIMRTVLQPDNIELLKRIHISCLTNAEDIDEPKYTLQKKLSEVCGSILFQLCSKLT